MCTEVQIAFGLLAWLCHDCRKAWHKQMKEHPLHKEFSEAQLKLEFWKARVGPMTPSFLLEEGLIALREVIELERKANDFANQWLIG
jgi:hypothetical protein